MKARLPSRRSRSQLSELRRLLRSEVKLLMQEWQRLNKERLVSLERISKALDRGDDATLMAEFPSLKEELEISRRALARVAIAAQKTDKLRAEWHDWELHRGYTEDASHTVKRERQEMIESELRMRGVRLSSSELPSVASESVLSFVEPVQMEGEDETEEMLMPPVAQAEEMAAEEEDEETEPAIVYWDALIASVPPEQSDDRSLARLLRAFRQIHGAQKSIDKRRGQRRYRLSAFDAWS